MINITVIHSPMDSIYNFKGGLSTFTQEASEQIQVTFFDTYSVDTNEEVLRQCEAQLKSSSFTLVLLHGGICQFRSASILLNPLDKAKKYMVYSGIEDENRLYLEKSGLSPLEYSKLIAYIANGTPDNCKQLFIYCGAYFGKLELPYEEAIHIQWEGIYRRGSLAEQAYEGLSDSELVRHLWDRKKTTKPVDPIVAILFYTKLYHEKDLAHIDALIDTIQLAGAIALPIFTASAPRTDVGCRGLNWVIENLLKVDGETLVDALINTIGYSQSVLANPGDGTVRVEESIFNSLGVAAIQAFSTYQSFEDWKENLRGIDGMSFVGSVYYPEFDGQLTSTTYAYVKWIKDEIGYRMVHMPIIERADHVSRLAVNWGKLKLKENAQKKVAILFHNMPPRNDMIGCAFGLDTSHCVFDTVAALKAEGVQTAYDFETPDDIIYRIIKAVSNDQRWLTAEDAIKRSVGNIEQEYYQIWFNEKAEKIQGELERDWGRAPGEFMVHEGRMPVPGILNGNIFIGLQPARGYEEHAEATYHSTDIVPPHQYMGYYDWLKNDFGADVIAHIGTHGTVEWLPGKEIGLSCECYSDAAMSELPHLYPYCITVLGEGIQAKRRSNAVILDHLIPSLMRSDTYEGIEEIENLLIQYHQAAQADQGKIGFLKEALIEKIIAQNLHLDLKLTEEDVANNLADHIEKIHLWVDEIKNTLIKDGLHYYGKMPEDQRLSQLLCALLRLSNGEVPSIQAALAKANGMDWKHLKDHPMQIDASGLTNLTKANGIETLSQEMMAELVAANMDLETIKEVLGRYQEPDLNKVIEFASREVILKLEQTDEELKHLIEGINGRFVKPGAGGAPTRGNVHILPTGRNFFSVDPESIPSRASWRVGHQLAKQLVDRFIKEEGRHPESIAIVIYAGETMKTSGDDIAQILWLMGIQPKWLEGTDKVIGLEAIAPSELEWPRIDATLRISGLFRDTFPNLIEWMEEAVQIAVGLDEPYEVNYIKKHFEKEVAELIESGVSLTDAQEEASMRIFSDPPGTYGAGVDTLINSKKWETVGDLGAVYTFWGGHAYGKKVHGKRVTEVFERRLMQTEITVKNESSMEIDMLESDDFYNYHGGLIAAVRKASGQKPKSYCGDTSDPSRVKTNDVKEQSAKIMRARILNPKWFESLKVHGYKGAQEVSGMMDFVFGWDATADVIEDWMYDSICDHFLRTDERKEWMEEVNPWAIQNISERLMEASQRGMWQTSEERLEALRQIYLEVEGDIEGYE